VIEVPPLEELREARRRLAEEYADVQRYAAMLQETCRAVAGVYVHEPLVPRPSASESKAKAS
jgi:hypothetical protein